MRSILHGRSGVLVLAFVKTWQNVKFQLLANAKLKMLVRSSILLVCPLPSGCWALCPARFVGPIVMRRFVASKPLGSVLGCWGAVVSPFPCNFGISVSSPCLRLISVGWLALLLGPLPSSCGPVSGLLCVGVGTAVLGSAVSSSVGTCTLMLFGLPASSLRSFGTICPRVLVLSGRVTLALPPMLCVLGWRPRAFLRSVRGFGNMPLLRSLSMLLCPLLVTLCLLCLVLLVMPCGKVGVLGSSRSGRLRVGMRFLLSLPWPPLSFVPSKSMMFVLGCFLLPLLLRLGWVPRSLLPLGIASPVSVILLSALGGANLLGTGITSAGLCSCRPAHAPDKPACAFLARFGWTLSTNHLDPTQVTKVRGWLTECQSAIWSAKDH